MALPHRERYVYAQLLESRMCIAKMTATPAGCVRTSQAGTKLDRTQTAVGLLWFAKTTNYTAERELINSRKTSAKSRMAIDIGARGVSGTAVTAGC